MTEKDSYVNCGCGLEISGLSEQDTLEIYRSHSCMTNAPSSTKWYEAVFDRAVILFICGAACVIGFFYFATK